MRPLISPISRRESVPDFIVKQIKDLQKEMMQKRLEHEYEEVEYIEDKIDELHRKLISLKTELSEVN